MTTALAEFAKGYGTDKFSEGNLPHGYDVVYGPLFEPWRDKPIRLLELGVMYGSSVKLWRDYFHNGQIFGLDISPPPKPIPGVTIFEGDQADPATIATVGQHGPFDIIIDDASHVGKLTTASFKGFVPYLAPCGIYCVEDLRSEIAPRFRDPEPFTKTGLAEALFLAQGAKATWSRIIVSKELMVFCK